MDDSQKQAKWELIDPSIRSKVQRMAEGGHYDPAIFEAFKFVEAEVQERVGSRNFGRTLLNEAFDGRFPKILISKDPYDREGIKEMFSGALANIRGDRGHKKDPFIPCKDLETCLRYLSFASLLHYLLGKDRNIFPTIELVKVSGNPDQPLVELRGRNFGASPRVISQSKEELRIIKIKPAEIEVSLPPGFSGKIKVISNDNESNEVKCDAQKAEKPDSWREVIAVDVPLYEDSSCTTKRPDVVGLLLRTNDVDRIFREMVPTRPNKYQTGCYVTHGPFDMKTVVGESWYRDPQTGEIGYAWTSSSLQTPEVICKSGNFVIGGIAILPRHVETQPDEPRAIRVLGWGKDGSVRMDVDLSRDPNISWSSKDESVAAVSKSNSTLYPKNFGRTIVECSYKGYAASSIVDIGQFSKGKKVVYFQGLSRLQQIRFDNDDNLYVCNQSAYVFRISRGGVFEQVIHLPELDFLPSGIDCIEVDEQRNLYFSAIGNHQCYRANWNGNEYNNPSPIGTKSPMGSRKGIVVDPKGNIYIAVMAGQPGQGYVIHMSPNGEETFFSTRDTPIYLALDPEGNICTPSMQNKSIDAYSPDGKMLRSISCDLPDSPSDIMIDKDGAIYLPLFHSGTIVKIPSDGKGASIVADGFRTPGGITRDSKGRLFVSNFDGYPISSLEGNTIEVIY